MIKNHDFKEPFTYLIGWLKFSSLHTQKDIEGSSQRLCLWMHSFHITRQMYEPETVAVPQQASETHTQIYSLSQRQTIDKVGQLLGRGLVCEDNRLMKLFNRDTCHLSRHDCDVKKRHTTRTPTLLYCLIFWLPNNIKSAPYESAVGYSTGK